MESAAVALAVPFLGPVFALNIWTLCIEGVMYYYRLPVFVKLDIGSKPELTHDQIEKMVPAHIRWKADNYNHLMEQPTNFYATTLAVALGHYWNAKAGGAGLGGHATDLKLAWAYVALRVVHSYWQCCGNQVPKRFYTFLASSGVLGTLVIRGALRIPRGF